MPVRGGQAQPDKSRRALLLTRQLALRLGQLAQRLAALLVVALACVGQPHLARGALEQAHAQPRLHARHRPAHRRCRQPGVSVAGLALAHGINANLLRKWIHRAEREGDESGSAGAAWVPVRLAQPQRPSAVATTSTDGTIELELAGGTIRLRGRVEASTLSMAIDCLARRA